VCGLSEHRAKSSIALGQLRTEFKGKVEVLPSPAPVLRDLRKLSAEVIREESEKTPIAGRCTRRLRGSTELVGPWDHVAEGAYHRLVAG